MELDKELIMIGLELEIKEEVLETLGRRLVEAGYVKEDFIPSVLEREKVYPTGLPTSPYAIAIPHTDADKVIKPKIALATLKKEVTFSEMGKADSKIDVKIVIMLALDTPDKQLEILTKLSDMFQNKQFVEALGNVQDADECVNLLSSI